MPSEVVGDTTDPNGTLRPNLPPQKTPGKEFKPLYCPPFAHQKHIPPNTNSPFQFWSLLISRKDIEGIVENTNARAYKRGFEQFDLGLKWPRIWREVSVGEIYIWLGIWVLMGIHPEPVIEHYWSGKPGMAVYKDITGAMSCNRWQDISRNLHISDPSKKMSPFEKVEPLNVNLRTACLKLWTPGRDLAVDEMMERFQGRSFHTTTIKTKPEPTGFKIWGIGENGYLLNWFFHSKGNGTIAPVGIPSKKVTKRTPIGKPPMIKVPKELGQNQTAATVPLLLNTLPPPPPGMHYHGWVDNLFTSTKLFCYLRGLGYGASGTANSKSGILKHLSDLKKWDDKHDKIKWGSLIQVPSEDGQLIQSAWKDNSCVLYLSTTFQSILPTTNLSGIPTQEDMTLPDLQTSTIFRPRKRPSKTSSSAKTAREPHGENSVTELPIPCWIHWYNCSMGHVDVHDQLQASYHGMRRIRRGGWRALFHFCFQVSLVNAYKLSEAKSHFDFRRKLGLQMIGEGMVSGAQKPSQKTTHKYPSKRAPPSRPQGKSLGGPGQHFLEKSTRKLCVICDEPPKRRKRPLGEISGNIASERSDAKRKRSCYSCTPCNVAICLKGTCFEEHLRRVEEL